MNKKEQGFSIIELVLVVCLVIILLGVGIFVAKKEQPKKLSDLLPAVAADLSNHYSNAVSTVNQWQAENVISVPQHVSGYGFAVSSASAPSMGFSLDTLHVPPQPKTIKRFLFFKHTIEPTNNESDLINEVNAYLVKNKFKPSTPTTSSIKFSENLTDVTKQVQTTTYTRGDDKCLLSQEQDQLNTPQISCFNTQTWTSIAKEDQPFVTTYLQTHPNSKAQDLVFGPLTIKSQQNSGVITASEKSGYDLAEAVIVDNNFRFLGLFYQHDSQWHFITGANDEFGFSCSSIMSDPNARAAMYDQVCYDNNKGQIRVDTTRRVLQ